MTKNKSTLWLTLSVIGAVILLIVLAKIGSSPRAGGSTPINVNESGWFKGGAQANAVLIEYSDFQCPACQSYYPIVKQLNNSFGDRLKIVYRHFPLIQTHPHALPAAWAAEAAGEQNKFWEMHDLLFDKQAEWSGAKNIDDNFLFYATALGLNKEQFSADYKSQLVKDRVQNNLAGAQAMRLNSTPSFILNGKKINNPRTFDEFRTLIDAALENTPVPDTATDLNNLSQAEDAHEHADLAIYLNGKKFDFSPDKYQSDEKGKTKDHDHASHQHDPYVHIHDKKGSIIHKHKKAVTLGYFFKTIGMEFNDQCFITDDKTKYCAAENNSLKFFVNGARRTENGNYELNDLDRILISYGPLTDPNLAAQLKSVTDESCIYSEKCPERGQPPTEKCVGGLGTDCAQ